MKSSSFTIVLLSLCFCNYSCDKETQDPPSRQTFEWLRSESNPVFQDLIPEESYEVASDGHVFFDEENKLRMIYTGDANGKSAIKLANGSSWTNWASAGSLLSEIGPSNLDAFKETSFYRKTNTGTHQIYYIGYASEETYEAQIFMAEAESLTGPYTQMTQPIIPKGTIAGKEVYCMTSPSIMVHEGALYMTFIGWNAAPNDVTEVWVMGAISNDDGLTWNNFQLVDTRIGMEGQVTKTLDNTFVAVRTAAYLNKEAIYYATASHPFGPWTENEEPILIQTAPILEKDEIIAPQITIEPQTGQEYLYYTGADQLKGWWMMMATKK